MITNATVLPAMPCALQAEYHDAAGLMAEFDDSLGYTSVMTVQVMSLPPLATRDVVPPPDNRPIFVVAHQHGQYLDFIRRHGLNHWSSPRVTRIEGLAGLFNCRIVLLKGWERLSDSATIAEALARLRSEVGISIIECDPGGACFL